MSAERFYVVELEGRDTIAVGSRPPSITCSVLDRFYCHHEVARYKPPLGTIPGETARRTRVSAAEWVRRSAAAEAARLNEWARA